MEPPGTSDSRPPPPPVPCLELSSSGQFRDRTDDETETAGGAGSCRGACEGLGPSWNSPVHLGERPQFLRL